MQLSRYPFNVTSLQKDCKEGQLELAYIIYIATAARMVCASHGKKTHPKISNKKTRAEPGCCPPTGARCLTKAVNAGRGKRTILHQDPSVS